MDVDEIMTSPNDHDNEDPNDGNKDDGGDDFDNDIAIHN